MDVNITTIGSGVVGLAIASYLSSKYDNIFLSKNTNVSVRKPVAKSNQ